jgi:chromosome segregation ATPase
LKKKIQDMQEDYDNKNLEKNFRMERLGEDVGNLQKIKGKLETEVDGLKKSQEKVQDELKKIKKEYDDIKRTHHDEIKSLTIKKTQEIVYIKYI